MENKEVEESHTARSAQDSEPGVDLVLPPLRGGRAPDSVPRSRGRDDLLFDRAIMCAASFPASFRVSKLNELAELVLQGIPVCFKFLGRLANR